MTNPLEINVSQTILDLDDIKTAVEEREIEVGSAPTYEYGDLIRSIPEGENMEQGVIVHSGDTSGNWIDITVYGDMYAEFMKGKTNLQSLEFVNTTKIRNDSYNGCTGLTSVAIIPTVDSVGAAAFRNCTALSAVTWEPQALTSVGSSSYPIFQGCKNISTVRFGDGITHIPSYLFSGATDAPMGDMVIPETVTYIGSHAFNGCGVTSVDLPEGLLTMGGYAFNGTDVSGELVIPSTLTSIGAWAFHNCTGLTKLVWLPPSISSVYNSSDPSFEGCTNIKEVQWGENITHIPGHLCAGFTALEGTMTIPETVTFVGAWAFHNCTGLTKLVWLPPSISTVYNSSDPSFEGCTNIKEVEWGQGITHIPDYLCNGFSSLEGTMTIPETVTYVGKYAFGSCTKLTKLVWLPPAIKSVYNSSCPSFAGCSNIAEVEWNENVTHIPGYLCRNFTAMEGTLTIPKTVTYVGSYAFSGCTGITKLVWLPPSISSVYNGSDPSFEGCVNISEVEWGEGITHIPGYLCNGFTKIEGTMTIPETVTYVGAYAFQGCTGLTKLVWLPPAISSVYNSSNPPFAGCTNIKEVEWSEDISIIPEHLCRGLTGLEGTITIPETVTAVGAWAFQGCTGITKVEWLAPDISSVYNGANRPFDGCTAINTVDVGVQVNTVPSYLCYGLTGLTTFIIRNSESVAALSSTTTFTGTPIESGTGYIYVPARKVDDYKLHLIWANYAEQIRAIEDYPDICG